MAATYVNSAYEDEEAFLFYDESEHQEREFAFGASTVKQRCLGWVQGSCHHIWPGSHSFGEFVVGKGAELFGTGSKVVELGAGNGLIGLLAAQFSGNEVVITDGDRQEVLLISENASRYGAGVVSGRHLAWGTGAAERAGFSRGWADVVLACEVCYVPANIPLLVESMDYLLAARGSAYLCNACVSTSSDQEECAEVLHASLSGRGFAWEDLGLGAWHDESKQGALKSTSYLIRIWRPEAQEA